MLRSLTTSTRVPGLKFKPSSNEVRARPSPDLSVEQICGAWTNRIMRPTIGPELVRSRVISLEWGW